MPGFNMPPHHSTAQHNTAQHNTARCNVHCSVRERTVLNEFVCLGAGDSVSGCDDRGRICGVWLLDVVGRNRVEMAFDISPDEKAGSRRGTAASKCLCVFGCQDLRRLIESWMRGSQHMVATVSFVDSRRPDVASCLILSSTYAA